jgi:hypothetical protein
MTLKNKTNLYQLNLEIFKKLRLMLLIQPQQKNSKRIKLSKYENFILNTIDEDFNDEDIENEFEKFFKK